MNDKGFFYYFKSNILLIIIIILFLDFLARYLMNGNSLNIDFDYYIKVLISVAGMLIGLSLVVVYSLFNSNLDTQKGKIEENFDKLRNQIMEQNSKASNVETETSSSLKYIANFNNIIMEYITPLAKINSIEFFLGLPLNSISLNTRQSLNNYYFFLLKEKRTSEIFFPFLKKLIERWNGPDHYEIEE
jgi:hypothetical protein